MNDAFYTLVKALNIRIINQTFITESTHALNSSLIKLYVQAACKTAHMSERVYSFTHSLKHMSKH
jgi:hypothetical protein